MTGVKKLIQSDWEKIHIFNSQKDRSMNKQARLTPEQIVAKLRQIEVRISQGKDVITACRESCTTDKSYYRWRREYGGMKVDQAKRLKQLEQENIRLKRLIGELHLEKAVLTDVAKGNF